MLKWKSEKKHENVMPKCQTLETRTRGAISQAKATVILLFKCDLRRCSSSSRSGGSIDLLQSEAAFVPQFLHQPSDYFNSWQDPPEQKPFLGLLSTESSRLLYIGLACSITVELILQPTRAANVAKLELSRNFHALFECASLFGPKASKAEIMESLKKLRSHLNLLKKFTEEAQAEPSFWFTKLFKSCQNWLICCNSAAK
ncbi:Uncharacterized protein Rs2_06411 [Raphanus sativus]|nr:Uncharacterized protein Rs2_06411 [Raphanus sativus]